MNRYNVSKGMVEIQHGSITRYRADALVCPANGDLEMVAFPGGVQFAFLSDGGEEIFEEAKRLGAEFCLSHSKESFGKLGYVPEFSAHITEAGRLPVKHVIHSVAVGIKKDNSGLYCNREVIGKSTRNVLNLARDKQLRSIGFPALGTGLYNVPIEEAVNAMGEEFASFLKSKTSIERIGLILYSSEQFETGKKVFDKLFG